MDAPSAAGVPVWKCRMGKVAAAVIGGRHHVPVVVLSIRTTGVTSAVIGAIMHAIVTDIDAVAGIGMC